ncbi:hypothetical protein GBA52_026361 [Prunus armeniaca]|nr:hypothetical protein GBA52_026361 [Prunus armeniaca]
MAPPPTQSAPYPTQSAEEAVVPVPPQIEDDDDDSAQMVTYSQKHGGNADQNVADLDDNGGDFNTKQAHENTNFDPIIAAAPD